MKYQFLNNSVSDTLGSKDLNNLVWKILVSRRIWLVNFWAGSEADGLAFPFLKVAVMLPFSQSPGTFPIPVTTGR